MLNKILSLSPWLEVSVRTAYWRSPLVHRFLSKLQRSRPAVFAYEPRSDVLPKLIKALSQLGVTAGDILIVHSDVELLKRLRAKPSDVNQALMDLLGPTGTLVMPAYPLFTEEPKGRERLTADVSELLITYDPRRTPIWTGLLPHALMRTAGAKRSLMPINSLVALGPHAGPMFAHELDELRPLPCGKSSAWNYCYRHNAKVVSLNVDLAHSLTMNHVAEDSYPDEWPIQGWYRDRRFKIVTPDGVIERTFGERCPRWAMNYAERTLARDLRRAGLMQTTSVDGICIEMIEAKAHVDFLNHKKVRHYPYYLLPLQKAAE